MKTIKTLQQIIEREHTLERRARMRGALLIAAWVVAIAAMSMCGGY